MAEYPQVEAELERGPDCWLWVIPRCPLCGRRHTHGGGPLDGEPRRLLGHRVAHCAAAGAPGGYVLVEKGVAGDRAPVL